jgi:hypothetical protein
MARKEDRGRANADKPQNDLPIVALRSRMQALLGEKRPRPDDVRLLLTETRIAVEHLSLSSRYPTIWIYGNWCCHPELDQSPRSYDIVAEVQRAYEHCKFCERVALEREELKKSGLDLSAPEARTAPVSPEPMGEFFRNIAACFRHQELRDEFLRFYGDNEVDTSIIRIDSNWTQMLFLIMHSVANRPLAIPESSDRFRLMLRESEHERLIPRRFFVEEKSVEGELDQVELWWVIEMLGPYRVSAPLIKGTYPRASA